MVRFVAGIAAAVFLYLGFFIAWASLTDYEPDNTGNGEKIALPDEQGNFKDSVLTFLSWNIGYAGLGAEMDFFYDGGEMVKPTSEQHDRYFSGILRSLQSEDTLDFILLQEVDRNSTRTQSQDQAVLIERKLPDFSPVFCTNYKVRFVPVPFFNPLGRVEMGQMTLSGPKPVSYHRYSYPAEFGWPFRLFMPDRCFVVTRYPHESGVDVVVINTHNSAYDTSGKLREQEMPVIRDYMLDQYEQGHYVIAGGDWNQNPPHYQQERIDSPYRAVTRILLDDTLFPEDWTIAWEPQKPTNRDVSSTLHKEITEVTIIDYFIVSPNVQVTEIQTRSQEFRYSDHEPVFLKVKLK